MAKPVKHYGKWRIRWVEPTGERRSEVFENRNDAVLVLQRNEVAAAEVRRGLRLAAPPKKTVNELCDYWLKNRTPLKRSPKDDESIIRRHIRPAFGHLLVTEVGVAHIDKFRAERVQLQKKTVNNALTTFITMMKAALELGWLLRLPAVKKPKVRLFNKDYRYIKTRDEIHRFLQAAKEEGEVPFAMFATAIYTGARAGELAALRWDDVNFEQRLIRIERSFDGPTKAEDLRFVPILDALLPTLRAWKLRCPGALLFPNETGGMYGSSGRIFQEVFHRVLDQAGFPKAKKPNGGTRWYITFHGLRHSFASHWMMAGGDIFRLQKILGHKSMQMTERYSHLAQGVYVADYGRLGSAPDLEVAEVLPLRPATASGDATGLR
jgi:integrase